MHIHVLFVCAFAQPDGQLVQRFDGAWVGGLCQWGNEANLDQLRNIGDVQTGEAGHEVD